MSAPGIEMTCPACKREALVRRKPKYDGFKKVGEELSCAQCGHVFDSEAEVPFKQARKPALFQADDRPRTPKVFRGDENARLCRYCAEYVVNPFTQRCNRHRRDVQATDTCRDFTPKPSPPPESAAAEGAAKP
jgi:uncharacterized protein YbaR (Trm112 family)